MPPAARLTFTKDERLCGRAILETVAKQGKAVNVPPFRLIGLPMVSLPTPISRWPPDVLARIAFAVPKRNLPHAVDRNTTKRRMREAYRLQKPALMAHLQERGLRCAWLLVYQGKAVPAWEPTERKITRCLQRWLQEHGEGNRRTAERRM